MKRSKSSGKGMSPLSEILAPLGEMSSTMQEIMASGPSTIFAGC